MTIFVYGLNEFGVLCGLAGVKSFRVSEDWNWEIVQIKEDLLLHKQLQNNLQVKQQL